MLPELLLAVRVPEAVVNPRGCLDGKGVECRRQAGGGEQNASGGEDNAEEALGV